MDTPQAYLGWLEKHGITHVIQPFLYTIVSWVGWCSPPAADKSALALACMDLTGVFFLDDCPPAEVDQHFDDFECLLKGDLPRPTAPAISHAYRELLTQVQACSSSSLFAQYLDGRRALVRGYRRRRELTRSGGPIRFAEYLKLRVTTIFVDQWVDLWEALGSFELTGGEELATLVLQTRRMLSRWHVLENELSSESRDVREGVPNLVQLDATERRVGIVDARKHVAELANRTEQTLVELLSRLRATAHDESFTGFLELVKSCHEGGTEIYRRADPTRYTSHLSEIEPAGS